jgi:hypothetical protein
MIELRAPDKNVNADTPEIIKITTYILSGVVIADISP